MFSFFCLSATVGAVIATVQVVSALRGAEDALPLQDVATVSLTSGLAYSCTVASSFCFDLGYV